VDRGASTLASLTNASSWQAHAGARKRQALHDQRYLCKDAHSICEYYATLTTPQASQQCYSMQYYSSRCIPDC